MSELVVERRRTGLDVVFGALLVLGGVLLLGYATWTTVFSVLLAGWMLVVGGLVELVGAFFRIRSGGFWSPALGGVLLMVLGLVLIRNPVVAVMSLTLTAGALFLVSGLARLAVAVQTSENRVANAVGGVVSTALGLMVLFNLFAASFTLLGVLLAVQIISEGLVLMLMGRMHVVPSNPTRTPVSA